VQQFCQKCCRVKGSALVAVRRQRNTLRNTHARGAKGEKSESFSRESEQDRSPFLTVREHQTLGNVPVEHFQRTQKQPHEFVNSWIGRMWRIHQCGLHTQSKSTQTPKTQFN
jgi:hypothetical protein